MSESEAGGLRSAPTAVITGGGTGIGYAAAEALIRAGFRVVIAGRREDVLESAVRTLRAVEGAGEVTGRPADISVPAHARGLISHAVEKYGRLDCLVASAGVSQGSPFIETSVEEWDDMMNVNLRGVWICAQAAARHMVGRRCGRIILIGSIAGRQSEGADLAHYCAAKAGVHSLAQTYGAALAPYGVLVNAIAPGWVDSPMAAEGKAGTTEAALAQIIPSGKICDPSELGGLIRYLATDAPASLVGTVITVDGGQSALMSVPPRSE
jgi:NAD(P)-dependent dehydrogenase (short-subunit alcohol dehydrogenase family)